MLENRWQPQRQDHHNNESRFEAVATVDFKALALFYFCAKRSFQSSMVVVHDNYKEDKFNYPLFAVTLTFA